MLAAFRFSSYSVLFCLSFLFGCQAQETSIPGNSTPILVENPNIVFTIMMPDLNCSDGSEFQKISSVIQFMNDAVKCGDCSVNNSILCPEQITPITVSQSGKVEATRYQLLLNTMVNAINCLSAKIEETVLLLEYVPKPEGVFIKPSKEMTVFEECQVYEETSNITDIEEILLLGVEDDLQKQNSFAMQIPAPEPEFQIDDQQLEEDQNSFQSFLDSLGLEDSELLLPLDEQRQLEKLLMQKPSQMVFDTPMSEIENTSIEQIQSILTQQNSLSKIDITQLQIAVSLSFFGNGQQTRDETGFVAEIDSTFSKDLEEELRKEEEEILADNSGLVHPLPDLVRMYKKMLGQE
eukprot:TRINITY_DN778_c2_g3_i2.p1 TRINITY_DN778_c2_g3~~TRINITY_DN778_c2_g3_i2.p1  ORF type:complete len:350 (+),score=47.42 TRINITY_DN778_c2_g3_i2:88-1137(+)